MLITNSADSTRRKGLVSLSKTGAHKTVHWHWPAETVSPTYHSQITESNGTRPAHLATRHAILRLNIYEAEHRIYKRMPHDFRLYD